MSTTPLPQRTDEAVQNGVHDELAWTPGIDAAGIGVSVEDGAVRLSGDVPSYADRVAAEHAAFRVSGVRAVIDDITVIPRAHTTTTEHDIADAILRGFRATSTVPDSVRATVAGSRVTLTGEVDWEFQRRSAQRIVQHIDGVTDIENRLTLSRRASAPDTAESVRNAIVRNAVIDAMHIDVTAEGTRLVLRGEVRSLDERRQAERTAWRSPHVTHVENLITVRPGPSR